MDTHEISANFTFLVLKSLPGLKHLRLEETKKAPKWSLSRPQSPSDLIPHPLIFGLQKLRVVSRRLPLDPLLEVVQTTPDLSALEMVALGGDHPSDLSALKKLAHTLHESCPRLRDVLLEEDEMSLRDFYYFLSLLDLDQSVTNTVPVRDRWMPFRSLNFSNNCPSGNELLDLVLSGSELLQDTLETLVIDNHIFTKSSSARVVEILTTFRKLRKLSLGKTTCVIRVADLFNTVTLDGKERVKILKPWACKDLVMLNLWIEGEYCGWCPPGVVDIKDDYREDRFYRDGFPLYEQLKAHLDSYRRLDQKQIRYTYL